MTTEQQEFLLEGEHVLWESGAEQFKIQEKPFSAWNLACWITLAAVVIIYAAAYVPGAIASGKSLGGIVLVGCVFAFIPAIFTYNSIHDCSTIIHRLKYVITDKRALVVNKDQYLAMDITPDTPFKVETRPNGNQILFLGSTTKSKVFQSRKLAVIGEKDSQNKYQGLVFYSISNAGDACKAAGLSK